MSELNVYLADLINQNKISVPKSEFFLDFAYDLVLDGVSDEEIESIVTKEINKYIKGN